MDNNENCIILKRKEYDYLVKLANSKKPDKLELEIELFSRYGGALIVNDYLNLGLSESLYKQLKRIILQLQDKTIKDIANMSWWERRKHLKQYKTK